MKPIRHTCIPLAPDHGWRSAPDRKILVIGRGAVRLDYPDTWVVTADEDSVKLHDRQPPDDDCVLAISYHRWPAITHTLPVAALVRMALDTDERACTAGELIVTEARTDLALAWGQGTFTDRRVSREAVTRLGIARKDGLQVLVTFDFWHSDLAACDAHWRDVLASMQLCQWVADPARGPFMS